MSLLTKKPMKIAPGVSIEGKDGNFLIRGAKGEILVKKLPFVDVSEEVSGYFIKAAAGHRQARMNEGTQWALLRNAVIGVSTGYGKILEVEGIGYRASVEGSNLILNLGFVNPVRYKIPTGINIGIEKKFINVSGIDKELVGRVAAEIRALKKPEPYKGKGIRYKGEIVRRKAGKKAATA